MTGNYQDWAASAPKGVGARFFDSLASTNVTAADLARAGDMGPLWVIAGEQNDGRGRRGRVWTSGPGNLYASLLLRPRLSPKDLVALPFLVALAIRDSFITLGAESPKVKCKWPNDVLIDGRKASGVLIESSARSAQQLDHLIIGIGMNLAHHPEGAQFPPTDLKTATGNNVPVRLAFEALAHHMFTRITNWRIDDFGPIAQEWTDAAWGLGNACELRTASETFVGTPESLGPDGGLIVRLDGGGEKRLYAGDIFPVTGQD